MTRSDEWKHTDIKDLLRGQKESFAICTDIMESVLKDSSQLEIAKMAMTQFHRLLIRQQQRKLGNTESINSLLPWQQGWYENCQLISESLICFALEKISFYRLKKDSCDAGWC